MMLRDSIPQSEVPASVSFYSGMVPNLRFNTTMAVIFGILWIFHVGVGFWTKQYWIWVAFTCACTLEVLGYVGRALSHSDVTDIDDFLLQIICLTIAPVFTMGGIYYQLAKLIEVYGHKFAILSSPMAYSYIFICCDIVSLVVQAVGGGLAGVAVQQQTNGATGDHIFVAGLAIQVASMSVFLFFWFHFLYKVYIETRMKHAGVDKFSRSLLKISQAEIDYMYRPKYEDLRIHPKRWTFHYFTLALTAAVIFVYVRCIYRVIELAEGWSGYLITHEWYFIILDAVMMSAATITLCFFHPGFVFQGRKVTITITNGKNAISNEEPSSSTASSIADHGSQGSQESERSQVSMKPENQV